MGAFFQEPVDLSNVELVSGLWLVWSRFAADARFGYACVAGVLSFEGSNFAAALTLVRCKIADALWLTGCRFGAIDARGARVGSQLNMTDTAVAGALRIDAAVIEGSLLMRNLAAFAKVDARGTNIGGNLELVSYDPVKEKNHGRGFGGDEAAGAGRRWSSRVGCTEPGVER